MKYLKTFALALFFSSLFVRATFTPGGYAVGDKVKDFSLKNIDGKSVALKDIPDAKGVILIFTCNTCPFAIAYEDRIVALHEKYRSLGYPVVAINPNDVTKQPGDSFEAMKLRASEKKFSFHYLHDENQEIAKQYGATKTPHVYLLKKSGNDMVVTYIGAIDDNTYKPEDVKIKYLENALKETLAGKKVSESSTKAIGCTIKWKNS